jgi:hypothetical protein
MAKSEEGKEYQNGGNADNIRRQIYRICNPID